MMRASLFHFSFEWSFRLSLLLECYLLFKCAVLMFLKWNECGALSVAKKGVFFAHEPQTALAFYAFKMRSYKIPHEPRPYQSQTRQSYC